MRRLRIGPCSHQSYQCEGPELGPCCHQGSFGLEIGKKGTFLNLFIESLKVSYHAPHFCSPLCPPIIPVESPTKHNKVSQQANKSKNKQTKKTLPINQNRMFKEWRKAGLNTSFVKPDNRCHLSVLYFLSCIDCFISCSS